MVKNKKIYVGDFLIEEVTTTSNWLADIARGSDCIGGWFNLSDLHGERPDVVLPS